MNRRLLLTAALLAALLAPLSASAQGGGEDGDSGAAVGRVWGALVLARPGEENRGRPAGVYAQLLPRLTRVFPDRGFELIGQHTQNVLRDHESWIVPSDEIHLKLDSRGPAEGGGMRLHLQLWRGDKVQLKTDAVLRPGSPLFIGGPDRQGGRLIFVVSLREE